MRYWYVGYNAFNSFGTMVKMSVTVHARDQGDAINKAMSDCLNHGYTWGGATLVQ